jgi:hypothetical protein
MRGCQRGILFAAFVVLSFFSAAAGLAQETSEKFGADQPRWYNLSRYNPMKLFKRPKSANDQLASDGHLEDKLTKQMRLQGFLPAETEMQEVCSNFKELLSCVAVLRLTKSLPVEFTCLKWDVTGIKPKSVVNSCAGPAGAKAMSLEKAIDLLKPAVDYRKEAKDALGKAREDIRDASS